MSCRDAAAALQQARARARRAPPPALEAAFLLIAEPPPVWALDSASLVGAEHVRTRSSSPARMAGCSAAGRRPRSNTTCSRALYNDAGIGIDEAGVSRLPALDARGIAAATVAAASARIGDARSTYEDGILSGSMPRAAALGLRAGHAAPANSSPIVRRAAAELGRNA